MNNNKYTYLWIIQGFYQRWEDLTCSENWKEAKQDLKAYRDNEMGIFRIIRRREINK